MQYLKSVIHSRKESGIKYVLQDNRGEMFLLRIVSIRNFKNNFFFKANISRIMKQDFQVQNKE